MTRIEQSVDVNVPLHTVYEQMTQFEQFPRFMEGVQEVRRLDDGRLRWRAKTADADTEWDAEITEQVAGECIAWRNLGGHAQSMRIAFQPLDAGTTRVTFGMDVRPDAAARSAQRTEQDLARMKKLCEAQSQQDDAPL